MFSKNYSVSDIARVPKDTQSQHLAHAMEQEREKQKGEFYLYRRFGEQEGTNYIVGKIKNVKAKGANHIAVQCVNGKRVTFHVLQDFIFHQFPDKRIKFAIEKQKTGKVYTFCNPYL